VGSVHSGLHFISIMDTPFDAWFHQIDSLVKFTFMDEILRGWYFMYSEKASLSILPLPSKQPTRISYGTDPMTFNEHQIHQLVLVSSKPVKESEYPGHITNEARQEMKEWILRHLHYPFLTKEEEDYFMAKYGILQCQVKIAFNN
jgi:hypothetical protein